MVSFIEFQHCCCGFLGDSFDVTVHAVQYVLRSVHLSVDIWLSANPVDKKKIFVELKDASDCKNLFGSNWHIYF